MSEAHRQILPKTGNKVSPLHLEDLQGLLADCGLAASHAEVTSLKYILWSPSTGPPILHPIAFNIRACRKTLGASQLPRPKQDDTLKGPDALFCFFIGGLWGVMLMLAALLAWSWDCTPLMQKSPKLASGTPKSGLVKNPGQASFFPKCRIYVRAFGRVGVSSSLPVPDSEDPRSREKPITCNCNLLDLKE